MGVGGSTGRRHVHVCTPPIQFFVQQKLTRHQQLNSKNKSYFRKREHPAHKKSSLVYQDSMSVLSIR